MTIHTSLPRLKTRNNKTVRGHYFRSAQPYAMRCDKNGYPHFLLYIDRQWVWVSAKYFEPVDED